MPHTPPRPPLLRRRRHDLLALALVLLVALLPRIVELGADPPARVLGAFLSDEGWWAQNARQRVLFGEWVMDEHNPALFAAPAYTAALTLTYQLAGLGLTQTRLLSALAGALACGVFYLGLRAVMPTRRALPPALLLALGGFGILLSRMALVETLQLAFAILAMAGVLAATRYPPLGALGGLGLVGAVLSKPNAVILAPVFAVAWWFDYRQRRRTEEPLRPLALQIAAFSGAVACSVVAVLVFFIWPNWIAVRDQLAVSLANVTTQNNRLADGGVLVFFLPFLSLRPSLLFLEGVVPMLGLALLAWRRVARPLAEPLDAAERLGWAWWWGVLAYVASQAYQPDRRFLLLVPAVALLGARGLFERDAGASTAPAPVWRGACGGALAGAVLGLYVMAWGIPPLVALTSGLHVGGEDGISVYPMQLGLWHLAVLGGAAIGAWLAPRPGAWRWSVPAGAWVVLFALTEPLSIARDLLRPSFSERDAARAIAQVSRVLRPERRVMTGFLANSLALESDIFPFYIRNEPGIGAAMNLDGWERFRPTLAVTAARNGVRMGLPLDPARHGLRPLCRIPLWHEVRNATPIEVTLWLTPDQPPPACPPPARPVAGGRALPPVP
ncbi:MAG: glycosyltransferase family 39 protein [Gemmatimonadetes bacterium]|nr:glycosyltransferase family 39 protein [Gemmatimonadota bacterium]